MFDWLKNYGQGVQDRMALQEIGPYQQVMAEQFLRENPDADFAGIPGYQQIQRKFEAKQRAQAPFGPMEKPKEAKDKTVRMGAGGFVGTQPAAGFAQGSIKAQVFKSINDKEQSGIPLSKAEIKWRNKYLGIDESATGPKTPDDRIRIRKMAIDMARADYIKESGDPMAGTDYEPSEEQISEYILDAAKYLYPNMGIEEADSISSMIRSDGSNPMDAGSALSDESKAGIDAYMQKAGGKTVNLDITLPKNIKKASQALDFLIKQGLNEDEAREWLRARMK